MPEVVRWHIGKEAGQQNIYVMDRGLQSTRTIAAFSKEKITFLCRSKEDRKLVEPGSFITEGMELDLGESVLVSDRKVQLYTGFPINKNGKKYYSEELVDIPFRLVVVKSKGEDQKEYWLLTNDFERSAAEISQAYRRRWDIEVFFRFLKQELNVSHLVSLNRNGIQVML